MPTFRMGHEYALTVSDIGGANRRDITVHIVGAKATKDLPPMRDTKLLMRLGWLPIRAAEDERAGRLGSSASGASRRV
jgi:hypothetical protein